MNYVPLERPSRSWPNHFWYHSTLHTLSVLFAATVVALFPAFAYRPWSLPTTYSLKTTQQYINFIVISIALLLSMLMSYCLALANDAEAQAEFNARNLSLAKLKARSEVSRKDVFGLMKLAAKNLLLWGVAAPYAIALTVFSTMSWVLSLIFVLEAQLSDNASFSTGNVTMGFDVPALPDPCRNSLTAANCTYDLATSALTSQLITHTPYTFANVTFTGPKGTQGLQIDAMHQFASEASTSEFGAEKSQYCLPILKPKLVSCSSVQDDSRAKYVYVTSRYDTFLQGWMDTYEIVINPGNEYNQTYVATSSKEGVMAVSQSKKPSDTALTVLTGSGQYADLLSRLSTGQPSSYTKDTYNETTFTLLCDAPHDQSIYSWQWVNFSLIGGVMTANSTGQNCRQNGDPSPMAWLDYALEGATAITNIGDGYSKLINTDYLANSGADYERVKAFDMSPLEYILSHMISIVNTAWTATNADIAGSTRIDQRSYEHRYIVTVEMKGVTILALCVACLVLLCTILQAWSWARAMKAQQREERHQSSNPDSQWQLLEPLQLLAYGAVATEGVSKLYLTDAHQRANVLRNRFGPILGTGPGTLLPTEAAKLGESRQEESSEWSNDLQVPHRNQTKSSNCSLGLSSISSYDTHQSEV